jgi:hypothetical protein
MTTALNSTLVSALEAAAAQAGLVLVSATEGRDFHGQPTAVFLLGLAGARTGLIGTDAASRTLKLELTEAFNFDKPELLATMTAHLAAQAGLLRHIGRTAAGLWAVSVALSPLDLRRGHLHRPR